ncbi:MAG: hypothetical protein U9Q69_01195 [Nanoarchaeota archaeon]|nr:hypothetical protein [Nanoarchaeota archaeon]
MDSYFFGFVFAKVIELYFNLYKINDFNDKLNRLYGRELSDVVNDGNKRIIINEDLFVQKEYLRIILEKYNFKCEKI